MFSELMGLGSPRFTLPDGNYWIKTEGPGVRPDCQLICFVSLGDPGPQFPAT